MITFANVLVAMKKNSLTINKMAVLELTVKRTAPLAELARVLATTRPSVSQLAATMIKEGLVSVTKPTSDRRVKHLAITEKGRATYLKLTLELKSIRNGPR